MVVVVTIWHTQSPLYHSSHSFLPQKQIKKQQRKFWVVRVRVRFRVRVRVKLSVSWLGIG